MLSVLNWPLNSAMAAIPPKLKPVRREDDLRTIGTAETDAGLISASPPKLPSFGRGRAVKLVRNRSNPASPGAPSTSTAEIGPSPPRLTLNAANISEEDLHQVLKDARDASQLVQIRDQNGKINVNFSLEQTEETSDIEFNSDISSR